MYDCDVKRGKLTLSVAGEPVLEDVVPHIVLDDGQAVEVRLVAEGDGTGAVAEPGAEAAHIFTYEDDDETVRVRLVLAEGEGALVASVEVKAIGGSSIGVRAKGLAPFGGLTLSASGLGAVRGLMANYLHKDWWTRPHFDPDPAALPPRTQSVIWQTESRCHQLLCVCDDLLKTEVAGHSEGLSIQASAYAAGYINLRSVIFVLASDEDPFLLPDRSVAAGLAAMGKVRQTRWDKRYPEIFEYLGWCSWDAFYHDVSAEGLIAKAAELAEKALPVRWFIIDDGWLSETERRLTSFSPDPAKFPDGFTPVIDQLKNAYGLWWVGIWHTLFGYWGGVDADSDLVQSFGAALERMRNGMVVPSADAAGGFRFWDAWHREMRDAGVDFVKVDCQSGLAAFWRHELAVGAAAQGIHAGLEASVGLSFDNAMINCMGMATENLWHRPTSALTRNSDDFFPKREESFIEHALQNAYNAVYHAPFMWLDWDMWWTQHEHAATHAVLRAVSGGPVYVSDRVGETDGAQLWPLVLSDGRLLRCDRPGMATADCLFVDPSVTEVPLKIWNRVGDAGVVAAVNVNSAGSRVTGTVGPLDVPGLEGERFVVYEHFTRRAWTVDWDGVVPISLDVNESALYLILPAGGTVTPIGLADKYISPATIADWYATAERTTVVLFEGGRFVWAAASAPTEVLANGEHVEVEVLSDGVWSIACGDRQGAVWIEIVS